MNIINHQLFTFVNINNLLYFDNKAVVPRDYTLYKYDCKANDYVEVSQGIFLAESVTSLKELVKDGRYKIYIPVGKHTIYFNVYNCLRDKLIQLIERALCSDCGCNDCNNIDCINKKYKECIKNQQLFTLLHSYFMLIKEDTYNTTPVFNKDLYDLLTLALTDNTCLTEELTYLQLLENCVNANTDIDSTLFKRIIGLYYITLYKYNLDFIDLLPVEEIDKELLELNKIFKYDKIKRCLSKIEIQLEDLIEVIDAVDVSELENTKVYYYQTELGISDDNITDKPFKLYSVVKQGYIFDFNILGNINFVIESTEVVNFLIEDLLGNDVTDDFILTISNTRVQYKSRNLITPSNLFFKFKKV